MKVCTLQRASLLWPGQRILVERNGTMVPQQVKAVKFHRGSPNMDVTVGHYNDTMSLVADGDVIVLAEPCE